MSVVFVVLPPVAILVVALSTHIPDYSHIWFLHFFRDRYTYMYSVRVQV